jgi:Tfp pilus assembly protein PilO
MTPRALQRQLRYRIAQLGLMGCVGLALLLAALAVWFFLLHAGEVERAQLGRTLAALQQQEAARTRLPAASVLPKDEQLELFYRSFAPATQLPASLQKLYRAAERSGVVLETGDYALAGTGAERLQRFRVALPLKGSFKQLVSFLDRVLQADRTVALESATFKRDKVSDDSVDARLVFVVFVDSKP